MKKVIITGANSFIGKYLTNRFLKENWSVTAVVRSPQSASVLPENVEVKILDLQHYGQIGELCGSCDCFVHLAWNGTRGAQRMDACLQQQNLECSLAGVRSTLAAGCGRVLLAGSQAEYGPSNGILTETSPCIPNTEYGKAKLRLYHEVSAICRDANIPLKESRIFSLYGAGDADGTMVMKILRSMLSSKECLLTEGIQMWDYLHVEDAVDALYLLCSETCSDGPYNLGSGDARPLRSYIEEMAQLTATSSSLKYGVIPYPETGMVSLYPDITKIQRETCWRPQIPFSAGIRELINIMAREGKE